MPIVRGYEMYGNNLILDVLKVAYTDLIHSRLTTYANLIGVITHIYKSNNPRKVQHAITTFTGSGWFGRRGRDLFLTDKGVELYLQLDQSHQSQITAIKAIRLTKWSIWISGVLAIGSIIATIMYN